jgi:hypothetical protein
MIPLGLTPLFAKYDLRELVLKHNDPANSYHLLLFDFVVIGGEVTADRDLVLLNFSSAWMLANSLSAIATGWGFQPNADVTSNFCRSSFDLVEFGVNFIPCQNNVLFLSLSHSEGYLERETLPNNLGQQLLPDENVA